MNRPPPGRDLRVPPDLRDAYRECRRLTRRYGTTYYWATRVLPADRRPHVHALYGFCRHADEIVDEIPDARDGDARDGGAVERRRARLDELGRSLRRALDAAAAGARANHRGPGGEATAGASNAAGAVGPGRVDGAGSATIASAGASVAAPAVAAVAHTAATFGIDRTCFDRFLRSMAMDLTVTGYRTWDDLCDYMDGSAAVIGEMMLPVLEGDDPRAFGPARDLGLAFQLTNFLRDVGEDLDRGRVYLPAEDLERFGVDVWARTVTPAWRDLMRFEFARAQRLYGSADLGIALLPPWSARAIRAARVLYARILDEIAANDFDVFSVRARVPTTRKLAVAAAELIRR